MSRVQTKQTLKLHLLAFVLALALVWYSLNPVPRPVIRKKREAEPPDERKRTTEPRSMPATSPIVLKPTGEMAEPFPLPDEDEDEFEWPEFIDG
jgi:hypothetical protein